MMNDGIELAVEIDRRAIERRLKHGYVQKSTEDLDEAIDIVNQAKQEKASLSLALLGNAAEILPELVGRSIIPDVVTNQTSAHDPLNAYYPAGLSKEEADQLRKSDPTKYLDMTSRRIKNHVNAMIIMHR